MLLQQQFGFLTAGNHATTLKMESPITLKSHTPCLYICAVYVIYVPRLLILGLSRGNCNSHLEMRYFKMGHFSNVFLPEFSLDQEAVWTKKELDYSIKIKQ